MTATTPRPSELDAAGLVAKLRAAYDAGITRPLSWRRRQLEGIRRMLQEREQQFLDALASDVGKPALEGWVADIGIVIHDIGYVLKHLDRWARPERVRTPLSSQPGVSRIHHEPLGVVLVITPWNYPVSLGLMPLVGAIAAGNAAVVKPSEIAPATSAALADACRTYLDPDALVVVEGGVPETTALLEQRWDHIFYTGNGRVGRIVLEAAAAHLTPVTLELGGKSPAIVDREANLEVAARRIAWGKFLNAGQTCLAPDYVLVHGAVEDQLVDEIAGALRRFYGDDPRTSPDYARIVDDRHFERLTGLLEQEPTEHVVLGGGSERSERYIAPTVVRGVDADSALMTDEIFGPILPILTVPDVGAAIDFVNAREKPLALYVFSENGDRTDQVIRETSSGGACVNAALLHFGNPELPFGGVGASGMGRYHGKASFETFTHDKSVLTKPTRFDPAVAYPPYTRFRERVVRRLLG